MYITAIGNWGVRLLFSLLFVFYFDLGLNGFWLAMGVDIVIRTALISWRFASGKWQHHKVLGASRVKTQNKSA